MNLLAELQEHRLLAIVRGRDALRSAEILIEEGITLLEISLTDTRALEAIRRLSDAGIRVGAGTVLSAADARRAADAGAAFAVTPGLGEGVQECGRLGLPVLCGVLTPSEVNAALTIQAVRALKLFPASMGGPAYLAALRQPYPGVPFVPVGGVGPVEARRYLEAGAVAIGVGSPLLGDGEPHRLRERARVFASLVAR